MTDRIDLPVSKEKTYNFVGQAVYQIKGYVYAKNPKEALDLIAKKQYEALENEELQEVVNIETVEEE